MIKTDEKDARSRGETKEQMESGHDTDNDVDSEQPEREREEQ